MPGPQPAKIMLTDEARKALEKLVTRHTTSQQKAQRARIILKASAGHNHQQIAEALGISVEMATLWRRRWLALEGIALNDLSVADRLEDLPRPGAPARFSADQRCQIEQMACETPAQSGRPISQWSGREIADEMVKRGLVTQISARHAARLLKKRASNRTSSATG
jgi:putative transposase